MLFVKFPLNQMRTFLLSPFFLTLALAQNLPATVLYQSSLVDLPITPRNLSSSGDFTVVESSSNALWRTTIDPDTATVTYSNLVIRNQLRLSATNNYFPSISSLGVLIDESVILNIDLRFRRQSWSADIIPGVGGLTVTATSNRVATADVNVYGEFTFSGPSEVSTGSFNYHATSSSGDYRFFDGAKLLPNGDGTFEFSELFFSGSLSAFYPSAISPWIAESVDGVTVFYGDPGIQRLTIGDSSTDYVSSLTMTVIPEPSISALAFLSAAGFVFYRRPR